MRAVHADNERAHVGRGAGTRDENQISLQAFAIKHIGIEEITRSFDDALFRQQDDIERHEQAGRGNERPAERDADRARAGDSGESFGNPDIGDGEFVVVGLGDDASETAQSIDERYGKKLRLGENDALRFAGCQRDDIAQRDWGSLHSPDHGGCFGGVLLKGRGEIDHLLTGILCKVKARKSRSEVWRKSARAATQNA